MRFRLLALLLVFISSVVSAQNQLGFTWSSYGGMHTALVNPASLGTTHLRTQVCIAGGDVGLATNFLRIKAGNGGPQFAKVIRFGPDLVDAVNGAGTRDPSQLLETNFTQDRFGIVLNGKSKNLNLFTEFRGPAAMLSFSKGTAGLYYRARASFQVRDMAEPLARLMFPGLKNADSSQFGENIPDNRFNLGANLMHEVGFLGGLRILDVDQHHFSIGGGLRYVMGMYSMDVSNKGLTLNVQSRDSLIAIQSNVQYRYTNGRYLSQAGAFIPAALGRGFGLDAGVMYEMIPDNFTGPGTPGVSRHKLRLGAALVDMGAIFYSNKRYVRSSKLGQTNTEIRWGGLDTLKIRNELDVDTILNRVFGLDKYNTRFTSYMPAAITLSADLNISGPFFVAFQSIQSLRGRATPGMRRFSTYAIAPRFELGVFEFSLPIGMGMGGGVFQTGFFARISGFYFGSDNFLPVLGFSGRGMNFYMGGFVPLRKKVL